jgi:hypothetical protein
LTFTEDKEKNKQTMKIRKWGGGEPLNAIPQQGQNTPL